MKKITLSFILICVFSISTLYAQYNNESKIKIQQFNKFENYLKINSFTPTVSLGIQVGMTKFSDTGSVGSGSTIFFRVFTSRIKMGSAA